MKSLSTSEKLFMTIGAILVIASAALFVFSISLVPRQTSTEGDPFSANYSAAEKKETKPSPSPSSTPKVAPTATPTPAPTEKPSAPTTSAPSKKPKATPTPDPLQPKERAYLLLPKAHALLTKTGVTKKPYEVLFKFEVDPKRTPCTFILEFGKKTVLEKKLKGSPSGTFQVKVKLSKPGQYFWKVTTQKSQSEKRELIIKD